MPTSTSSNKLWWFATLSLPIVIGLWFVVSIVFFILGLTTSPTDVMDTNMGILAFRSMANRILGILGILAIPLSILGIIMLIKKDNGFVGQAIQTGRTGAKKYIWVWAVLLFIYLIAIVFSTLLFGEGLLDTLLTQILGLMLAIFAYTGAIRFVYYKTVTLNQCFAIDPTTVLKYIVGVALYRLSIVLGLILFIVPGIIILIRAGFIPLAILKDGLGPIDAFKHSWKITKGSFWKLFGLAMVQGLLQFLGILVVFVGLFWTIPTAWISEVKAYQLLSKKTA